jgi:hypothetical protein
MSKGKKLKGHSHGTLEQIKIPVVMDGDLAQSIFNMVAFCAEHHFLEELIFCENAEPKLDEFMQKLIDRLDIEEREE